MLSVHAILVQCDDLVSEGRLADALAMYSSCLDHPAIDSSELAETSVRMGELHLQLGDLFQAEKSFTICINLVGAIPKFYLSRALVQRATISYKLERTSESLVDLVRCCNLEEVPVEILSKALLNLGIVAGHENQTSLEMDSYTRCIELPYGDVNTYGQALYNRAIRREQIGERELAFADYEQCLALKNVDVEWSARTLLARAWLYFDEKKFSLAKDDFDACIRLPALPFHHLAVALLNLAIISEDVYAAEGEIAVFDRSLYYVNRCIECCPTDIDTLSHAYKFRGDLYRGASRYEEAVEDYTKCIGAQVVPATRKSFAFLNRGFCLGKLGFSRDEISDYSECIMVDGAAENAIEIALLNRGISYGTAHQLSSAIADYTACIELPTVSAERKCKALRCRGRLQAESGAIEEALRDYALSIEVSDTLEIFEAYVHRGVLLEEIGRRSEARDDYTFCIDHKDTPPSTRITAYYNRAVTFSSEKNYAMAIAEYIKGTQVKDAPATWVADCHLAIGNSYFRLKEYDLAKLNYSLCLEIEGADDEAISSTLLNCAFAHYNAGTLDNEITCISKKIRNDNLENSPLAEALLHRGIMYIANNQPEAALVDFNRCINTPDTSVAILAQAHHFKGKAHQERGDFRATLRDYTRRVELLRSPAASVNIPVKY